MKQTTHIDKHGRKWTVGFGTHAELEALNIEKNFNTALKTLEHIVNEPFGRAMIKDRTLPKTFKIDNYKAFLDLLNKKKIKYLIVGAFATIKHTRVARFTNNLDIWIGKDKTNALKCAQALKTFSNSKIADTVPFGKKEIFKFKYGGYKINIYNTQGKLNFEDAYKRKVRTDFRGVKANFITLNYLIHLKAYYYKDIDYKDFLRLKTASLKSKHPLWP